MKQIIWYMYQFMYCAINCLPYGNKSQATKNMYDPVSKAKNY